MSNTLVLSTCVVLSHCQPSCCLMRDEDGEIVDLCFDLIRKLADNFTGLQGFLVLSEEC